MDHPLRFGFIDCGYGLGQGGSCLIDILSLHRQPHLFDQGFQGGSDMDVPQPAFFILFLPFEGRLMGGQIITSLRGMEHFLITCHAGKGFKFIK